MNALFSLTRSLVFGSSDIDADSHPGRGLRASAGGEVGKQIPTDRDSRLRKIFHSPLIVGASISANLKTLGPADRIMRRIGYSATGLNRIAANGMTSRRLARRVRIQDFERASVVIGVDIFFWDASFPPLAASLKALERISLLSEKTNTPLVLATIPKVTWPVFQMNREKLNQAIRARAEQISTIHLLDLERLNLEITEKKGFQLNGTHFDLHAVAPDGIHLSGASCEYLAEKIIELF